MRDILDLQLRIEKEHIPMLFNKGRDELVWRVESILAEIKEIPSINSSN